jgi:hypothetical protein
VFILKIVPQSGIFSTGEMCGGKDKWLVISGAHNAGLFKQRRSCEAEAGIQDFPLWVLEKGEDDEKSPFDSFVTR